MQGRTTATLARPPPPPRRPDWRQTNTTRPESMGQKLVGACGSAAPCFPDVQYTPQVYATFPRGIRLVPGAKNVSIICVPYKLIAHILIAPGTTWNDIRALVTQRLSLNVSGHVVEPMGILEVALAGNPLMIRGAIGCQDPEGPVTPFEAIPENGMVYVQQVRRTRGWFPLMTGANLPAWMDADEDDDEPDEDDDEGYNETRAYTDPAVFLAALRKRVSPDGGAGRN